MQQRRLKRHEIIPPITIENMVTGSMVGELVNLTTEGLMLSTGQEIDTSSIFQFALHLPEAIEGSSCIVLGVDCLWCRRAENTERYWSGYQVIDASPAALRAIDALIAHYAD